MTLGLAIAGVLIALSTLVWQWRTWLYEGPRLKVEYRTAVPTSQPYEVHWMVTAINAGRSPVEITGWGFELPNGNVIVDLTGGGSQVPLPYTLVGGHSASFVMPKDDLRAFLEKTGDTGVEVKAYVTTPVHGNVYSPKFTPGK